MTCARPFGKARYGVKAQAETGAETVGTKRAVGEPRPALVLEVRDPPSEAIVEGKIQTRTRRVGEKSPVRIAKGQGNLAGSGEELNVGLYLLGSR